MLVLTVGSFSVFGEIFEMTVNYQSDLAFGGFPSVLFSLYNFINLSGTLCGRPPYQAGASEIAGDRGFVLSLGGLCCLLGFCLICWGFVLSVGALYSNLMYPHPI